MKSFQKNKRFNRLFQSKVFLLFLGIVLLVSFYSIFGFMNKMRETVKNKNIVRDKIEELEKTKEKLNLDIKKLDTKDGTEESIRQKFGLAKEGEEMIMIVEDKNVGEDQKELDSKGFFSVIKSWFK
ncbi:MAG: septum formation initiator family protein [Burkholderiales bacterium]|nr:septum formation initiator family protein [Burkholderiales bacterium]